MQFTFLFAEATITLLDWAIVAIYLLGIIVIGWAAARRVTSSASFFISNRLFGKIFMTFLQFGTGTQSDEAVSVASKSFTDGVSGIWFQWLWLPATPFYWLIGVFIRRLRAVTMADFFEKRFDRSVSVLYAVMGFFKLIALMGLLLKTSSVTLEGISGGEIKAEYAMCATAFLFLIYGIKGGLTATIVTDLLQGLLIIVFSVLILPFALDKVGGISGIRNAVPNPDQVFSLTAPGGIDAFYITVLSFNAIMGFIVAPTAIVTGAGKTETQSRFGLVSGSLMKRFCTIAWTMTGLCGMVIYANTEIEPDKVYGRMAHDLLPLISPGLLGLFIAALMSAQMSSSSASMVCASGLFTRNIYKPMLKSERSDRHFLFVGKIASAFIVAMALVYGLLLEDVVKGLKIFLQISALMGMAAWTGLFWRRVSAAAAWAGTLTTIAAWLFMQKIDFLGWDFNEHFANHLPGFMVKDGKLIETWYMICYLLSGLIVIIIFGVLRIGRIDQRKLDELYECLRTPVDAHEPEGEPCTLPPGVKPGPRRVLINHPDFEIPIPSLISVAGFLITAIIVSLIVYGTVLIFSIGS